MEPKTPSADDERRIVELFAHRQPLYDAAKVRRLTGTTPEQLEAAFEEGRVEPVMSGGRLRYGWEDVANLALRRCTPREIARTLERAGHADMLLPLNHFHTIKIELPLYQIRLLHHLAEKRSAEDGAPRSISDILEYELAMLAAGASELDEHFPGFLAAMCFPASNEVQHSIDGRCLYCAGEVGSGEDVCSACASRHVPG